MNKVFIATDHWDVQEAIHEIFTVVDRQMKYLDMEVSLTCVCQEKCCFRHEPWEVTPCCYGHTVVEGGGDEFKYVLLNLVLNAQEAILEKRKKTGYEFPGTIGMFLSYSKNKITLRVQDNGGGISENVMEKVLVSSGLSLIEEGGRAEKLYRSKKLIEEKMSGSLHVANEGEGALFTLEFYRLGFCGNEISHDMHQP